MGLLLGFTADVTGCYRTLAWNFIYSTVSVLSILVSSWILIPFSHNFRDTQNRSKMVLSPKTRPFLGFLYWILPFLLLVSSRPAFQPPSSWTCCSFPSNLKSGLNILAPADVPSGLSLLWFQRNWDMFNIQESLVACLYNWSHRFGFDF